MVGDSISNLINGLKVASIARKESISIPSTNLIVSILEVLKKTEYISDFKVTGDKIKTVTIDLKYEGDEPKIHDAKRVSKFSTRVYKPAKELQKVKSGYGLLVVTTEKGVMTGAAAKKANVGGEVLFEIW